MTPDQTSKASAIAKAEVKRTEKGHAIAKAEDERAKERVAVAQSAKHITVAQLDDTANGLASLEAKVHTTDPNDADAIRWLVSEREILKTKRQALEGRLQREQEQLAKAEADASVASAAFRAAEESLQKARDHLTDCEYDAQEARYLKAGDPLPGHLAERRERRLRQEEQDRKRQSEADWNTVTRLWDPGEAVLSHDQHTAAQRMLFDYIQDERRAGRRPSDKQLVDRMKEVIMDARMTDIQAVPQQPEVGKQLQAGEQGWGHHARSFDSAPAPVAGVGFKGGTGKGEWDPFSKEND